MKTASLPVLATMTAWELIGFEGAFRIVGGRSQYDAVQFNDPNGRQRKVLLSRLDSGLRQTDRYVDPDTQLEILSDPGNQLEWYRGLQIEHREAFRPAVFD